MKTRSSDISMSSYRPLILLAMLPVLACAGATTVETEIPARMPVEVRAPKETTWDAAIAVMRTAGAEIANTDTVTGIISIETMLGGVALGQYADCGRTGETRNYPDVADVDLRVLGDSVSSTIEVIVRWQHFSQVTREWSLCRTSGDFEDATEQMIRQRAELATRRGR